MGKRDRGKGGKGQRDSLGVKQRRVVRLSGGGERVAEEFEQGRSDVEDFEFWACALGGEKGER